MSRCCKRPREIVAPIADEIVSLLRTRFARVELGGSLRRGLALVGDIDVVACSPDSVVDIPEILSPVAEFSRETEDVAFPRQCFVSQIAKLDVWVVSPESFGAGLLYATGSGTFNVIMRRYAAYRGLELRLTGVYKDGEIIASKTEDDCFAAVGWDPVPLVERTYFLPRLNKYLDEMNRQ